MRPLRARRGRVAMMLVAIVAFVSACSSDMPEQTTSTGDPTAATTTQPTVAAVTAVAAEPTSGLAIARPAVPRPTATATPAVPRPTATATPAVTPTGIPTVVPTLTPVDTTPVVIQGDDWTITGADVARAYSHGAVFVASIVEARGVSGLFELLAVPPATTEQILFLDKHLAGEGEQQVTSPVPIAGQTVRSAGTIGAVMLGWVFSDVHGDAVACDLVSGWAGDEYVAYELGDPICLDAMIAVDGTGPEIEAPTVFGDALVPSLAPFFPAVETDVTDDVIELRTCG